MLSLRLLAVAAAAAAAAASSQAAAAVAAVAGPNCAVPNASKVDCKQFSQGACESAGCCWVPAGHDSAIPWCFFGAGHQACVGGKILVANSTAAPPFGAAELAAMRRFFAANLDQGGRGGVIASPDADVYRGGSYRYAWMRDAALSMRTLLTTAEQLSDVEDRMKSYVQWVLRVQSDSDPHGIDVRTEPKFLLPGGAVYPGGWCRPQTDGPALRSTTLMLFSDALGDASYTSQYLWTTGAYNGGAIQYDLDWVAANWQQNSCDLWEEVQSTDFFWNRMSFYHALSLGSRFASKMGDSSRASTYASAASAVHATLKAHWNGAFIQESDNRKLDTAVICALNDAQNHSQPTFAPGSTYVAGTIKSLTDLFCGQLPINNKDTEAKIPGVLFGRYENDSYGKDGGGGWVLLSAAVAEQLYRGAHLSPTVTPAAEAQWRDLFSTGDPAQDASMDLGQLLLAAGDGIMLRIRHHTAPQNGHLYEQLNKNTGDQQSAYDLTWSYSAVLKAMHYRASVADEILARRN